MKIPVVIAFFAIGILYDANALTLDAVLRETVAHNASIAQAQLAVGQAAGRRLVLRAAGLPSLGIGGLAGDLGGSRAGEASNQPFAFGTGYFVQPLFNLAIPAARRLGDINLLIAEQQLNVALISQLEGARVAFYAAQYNRSLASVLGEEQRRLEANASSQESRYQAGLAKRDVTIAADITARALDPKIAAARHDYQNAVLKLQTATGRSGTETLSVDGVLAFAAAELDVDASTKLALERRADLQLARLIVQSANQDVRIAEAAYVPSVNAIASGDYIPVSGIRRGGEDSPRRSDQFVSSEIRAGVGYTWRVLDAGIFDGAVERKRATREMNQIVYDRLVANVPRELQRIRNNLAALRARHDALVKAADLAEQNAVSIRDSFANGRSSQLELRDAENSSSQVKTGLLEVAYAQSLARSEWDRTTGAYLEISRDTSNANR